jgi:lysyl-tRNA synthetase class 2
MGGEIVEVETGEQFRKLKELQNLGVEPYNGCFTKTHSVAEIRIQEEVLSSNRVRVRTAGRVMAIRRHGKALFADLQDQTGKIQIYAKKDILGESRFSILRVIDVGDLLGVEGEVFRTHAGELTILVEDFAFLGKCLRPLPEKWHGLKDVEVRYRKRYLDLIMNPEVRNIFILRSRLIREIRAFLDGRGFMEVETPMMQVIPGGALARPFKTFHNALGMELYLRIAPELFLKRLVVGGFEKVYEINRNFRNEGISIRHNPEFTMLELYEAYGNYESMMRLCEELLSSVVFRLFGTHTVTYQSMTIDFAPPWRRLSLVDTIREKTGIDILEDSLEAVRKKMEEAGVEWKEDWDQGKFVNELLERFVQPDLIHPTFVLDYPVEISPLAKAKKDDPRLAERFELFIGKEEIGNAYSELNDPFEQRRRFEAQARKRAKGDLEAHSIDEDYVEALEYGMPPTGGLGIGIDRLVMLLTDSSSIREVILFPLLRPTVD